MYISNVLAPAITTDMGIIMEPPLISAEAGKSTEHCRFMNITADPPKAASDSTSNHGN